MIKIIIESEYPRSFKSTIALLIKKALDGLGIKSSIDIDTPDRDYLRKLDALANFSEKNPIRIIEKP